MQLTYIKSVYFKLFPSFFGKNFQKEMPFGFSVKENKWFLICNCYKDGVMTSCCNTKLNLPPKFTGAPLPDHFSHPGSHCSIYYHSCNHSSILRFSYYRNYWAVKCSRYVSSRTSSIDHMTQFNVAHLCLLVIFFTCFLHYFFQLQRKKLWFWKETDHRI